MVSQRKPPQSTWPPSRAICVKWDEAQPSGIHLDIRLRSAHRDSILWRYEIEVKNTSSIPISHLEAQLTLYDGAGQPVGRTGQSGLTNRKYIATSWLPPFLAGETLVIAALPFVKREEALTVDKACLRITKVH